MLLGFALVTLASCGASAKQVQDGTSMSSKIGQTLDDKALRELLQDSYVTPIPHAGVITSPAGEAFLSNGVYKRARHRTSLEGTFLIQDSFVCVEGEGFEGRCRKVIYIGDEVYSFVDIITGLGADMTVRSID